MDIHSTKAEIMKTRTILTLALMLAITAACAEGPERDELEDEAAEAAEMTEADLIELPVALLARARVSVEAAMATALAEVPGGEVTGGELEEEDGKLIFSFDIRVDGQDGIEEVHVDALTGEVIAHEHEDADDEAGETDDDGNP